jgi:predicted RNase H-like HicB family nuclease
MAGALEFEFACEPQQEGVYYVYSPDLPGLHTRGEDLQDAEANASEALALHVDGRREDGLPLPAGVVRRRLAVPA